MEQIIENEISPEEFVNSSYLKMENIEINWDEPIKRKVGTHIYYQYHISYSNNPLLISKNGKVKRVYSLLVKIDRQGNYLEHFFISMLPDASNNNNNRDFSYIDIGTYNGMVYLYDIKGNLVSIEHYLKWHFTNEKKCQ